MHKDADDTRIALISNDIGYIKGDISEIKSDIKGLDGRYVTQEQLKELSNQITAIAEAQQKALDKQGGLQRFVPIIISNALVGVMVFLLIFFLNNVK